MRPKFLVASSRPASMRPSVLCLAAGFAVGLAGCVEQALDFHAASLADIDITPTSVASGRVDVSPRGATVALASMDGLPPTLSTRFLDAIVAEARSRDMTFAEPGMAHYQARVYLSAYPVAEGTALAYVWDVFQGGQARVQRLSETVLVKTVQNAERDPWGQIDDSVLTQLAIKAADNLAAFLSTTPQAVAAVKAAPASVSALQSSFRPLAFAPRLPAQPAIWPRR